MRNFLLACLFFIAPFAFAQAPVITGDVMLCPNTNGTATITGSTTYTTYQWYSKYWFTNDPYVAITGATSASFTYDWLTYDQSLLKVVVTTGGVEYESNAIQIDSYAFASLDVMHSSNTAVTGDGNGGFLLCEGGVITNTINNPYTIVQWFKNGVAIAGATTQTYVITEPGTYTATASPAACPGVVENTLPISVAANPNCGPTDFTPVIDGDVLLCPMGDGTAAVTNGFIYDTYQWQVKPYGEEAYTNVTGATAATFTYDAYNYSVANIRLVVTLNGTTYTSNSLFIDSQVFLPIFTITEASDDVIFDPDNGYLICAGSTISNTVGMPYSNAQWFKNDVAIEGATSNTYVITTPGTYYVTAAPDGCPNAAQTSLPIVVTQNTNCAPTVTAPVIAGDTMLCPNTNGTATVTSTTVYTTYQWYYKSLVTEDEYVAIDGATTASFTYDWFTYDQATFKVVVTLDGETYTSNTIFVDSYNWQELGFETVLGEGATADDATQTFLLCPGGTITNTLPGVFSENIQWFKDGVAIAGATNPVYVITEPGSYHVVASPGTCPGSSNTTIANPLVIDLNPDCTAGINDPQAANAFTLYPNPANSILNLNVANGTSLQEYTIFDVTGKNLMKGSIDAAGTTINVEGLATGTYIIKLNGGQIQATKMFIKQ